MSKEDDKEWPILAYYYVVEIDDEQMPFQEVTGLKSTLDVEELIEGGNNGFVYRLPTRVRQGELTLSRGITEEDSDQIVEWVRDCLEAPVDAQFADKRKDLRISLLNPAGEPVRTWEVKEAFPLEWIGPKLNAQESGVAIEELVLTYLEIRYDQ